MSLKTLNGVHIPHRKNTAAKAAVRMPPPATVTIPMSMHIGKPANCVVAVGDHVGVGQLIGEPGGFVSSPVYASVSGTVKEIGEMIKLVKKLIDGGGEVVVDDDVVEVGCLAYLVLGTVHTLLDHFGGVSAAEDESAAQFLDTRGLDEYGQGLVAEVFL